MCEESWLHPVNCHVNTVLGPLHCGSGWEWTVIQKRTKLQPNGAAQVLTCRQHLPFVRGRQPGSSKRAMNQGFCAIPAELSRNWPQQCCRRAFLLHSIFRTRAPANQQPVTNGACHCKGLPRFAALPGPILARKTPNPSAAWGRTLRCQERRLLWQTCRQHIGAKLPVPCTSLHQESLGIRVASVQVTQIHTTSWLTSSEQWAQPLELQLLLPILFAAERRHYRPPGPFEHLRRHCLHWFGMGGFVDLSASCDTCLKPAALVENHLTHAN